MGLNKNRFYFAKFYLLIKRGGAFIEKTCWLLGDIKGVPSKDRNPLRSGPLAWGFLHSVLPFESSSFLLTFDLATT